MKKTLLILSIIAVLAIIGIGIYFFFSAHSSNVGIIPPSQNSFPLASTTSGVFGANSTKTSQSNILSTSTVATSGITGVSNGTSTTSRLYEITSENVAPGVLVFDTKTKKDTPSHTLVRYINRKTGNMYSYDTSANLISRISNKTIPGVFSVSWLSDGTEAYLRYFSKESDIYSIATYALSADGSNDFFLPQGITQLSTYGTKSLLTLVSGVNGSIATRASANYHNIYTAFQTPLTKIVAEFSGPNKYLVYTKPSATQYGYAFIVNSHGSFEQITGPYKGLVARISPDGKKAIISYTNNQGSVKTSLLDLISHTSKSLPIATIVNKCVWTSDSKSIYCGVPTKITSAQYPDAWYQGAVTFTDRLWRIDVKNRYTQRVLDPKQYGKGPFDMTSLSIDPYQKVLSFINKKDGSLWMYKLSI